MTPAVSDARLFRRIVGELAPCRWQIAGLIALSLLYTPLTLLGPVPLKIAVDTVVGGRPLPAGIARLLPETIARSPASLLALAAALVVLLALAGHLLGLADSLARTRVGGRLLLGFRSRLFSHLQRVSLSYHDRRGTADASYRVQWDAAALRSVTLDGLIPLAAAGLRFVAMLYVMARLDGALALVALCVSPPLFAFARVQVVRLRPRWRAIWEMESRAFGLVQQALSGLRVVKAFGQEVREEERFRDEAGQAVDAVQRATLASGAFDVLVATTTATGVGVVLFLGVRHVQAGTLTLGGLLVVMAYLSQLYEPLETMSRNAASLGAHLASIERVFEAFDQPGDVPDSRGARPLVKARGAVAFRDVTFSYDGGAPALANLTLDVPIGRRLGIAGATGAGKTTLVNLLARFHDPTSGAVTLDGVDLRDWRLADLRRQFSIVLQEPVLFSTSIAENIAYGRPEATPAEIVAAARAANVAAAIEALPEGYATPVGERGMRLSGGERQRIALARAFLKDAPILILDEPTSSVDVATEAGIMEAMERLMVGRTTFLIAHRLETLAGCDALVRLDEGRVVERVDARDAVREALRAWGTPRLVASEGSGA